jgi:hypothetical protein
VSGGEPTSSRSRITGRRQRSVLSFAVPVLAGALAASVLIGQLSAGSGVANALVVGALTVLIAAGPLRALWLAVRFAQDRDVRFLLVSVALLTIICGGALAAAA